MTGVRIRQASDHLHPCLTVLRPAPGPFRDEEYSLNGMGRKRGGSGRVKLRRKQPTGAKFRWVLRANSGGRTLHQIANRDNGANGTTQINTILRMRSRLTRGGTLIANWWKASWVRNAQKSTPGHCKLRKHTFPRLKLVSGMVSAQPVAMGFQARGNQSWMRI